MIDEEKFSVRPPQSEAHNKVAIVTDSIAQVPNELVQKLGIRIMPFSVTANDVLYTDGLDLNPGNLYQRMRKEKDLRLSTAAPSSGRYYQTFKECHESGAEAILYVGLSGRLSAAISTAEEISAILREEDQTYQIKIFDSHMATMAQGYLVIGAAKLAQQGASVEMICDFLETERRHIGFAAGLETLEYLARGGRIGKAAYMLSNAIQILPVISINDEGEVFPVSRSHGLHKMMKDILHYVAEKSAGYQHISLAVMHADARQWAEELQSMAVDQFHPDEIFITDFTPVMVAHTGPGIIGLAYHWSR